MQNTAQNYDKRIASEQKTHGHTTTTTNTSPGVCSISPADLEIVRQEYVSILGELNIVKAMDIEWAMNAGCDVTAICDALEQTAYAPRPTHFYFRAILRRYVNNGIFSAMDAVQERRTRQDNRFKANRGKGHDWYTNPNDDLNEYY